MVNRLLHHPLELLDLVLAFLCQNREGYRVKHCKDKPSVSDVLMKFLGDVMQHLFHVLLVHTQEIIQHNSGSRPPESVRKLADTAHCIDVIWIANIKTIVYQQRRRT